MAAVESALRKVGAGDELVVVDWLKEEEECLRGLSKEPLVETLEREYYKLLVTLGDSEYVFLLQSQGTYLSATCVIVVNSPPPWTHGPT